MPNLAELLKNNPHLRETLAQATESQAAAMWEAEQAEKLEFQKTLDLHTDKIARLFYESLMQRILINFGYENPSWDNLGLREKKLWLEAASVTIEELQKTPVGNLFSQPVKRRIQ